MGWPRAPVPVCFLSDSTGICAEMMGSALLIQFQDLVFERPLIPFIATAEAHDLAERLSEEGIDTMREEAIKDLAEADSRREETGGADPVASEAVPLYPEIDKTLP